MLIVPNNNKKFFRSFPTYSRIITKILQFLTAIDFFELGRAKDQVEIYNKCKKEKLVRFLFMPDLIILADLIFSNF